MLSRKASAVVLKDGQRILINESSQIPDQPFEIRGIIQTGGVARPGSITDADCQVLAQIKTIDELSLSGTQVTAVGLRAFASSENIVSISIPRTAQDPAATKKTGAVVNAFPNLRCVSFPYFCGEEFAAEIQGNTSIVAVSLYRSHQTQQGIAHLVTLPNLKFLNALDTNFRKAELQQLSEFPQLQHLAITLYKDMPLPDLDSLANISTLKTIEVFAGDQRQAECDAYVRKLLPNCQPLNTDRMRVELIDFNPKPLDALN